ncbi:hypothetical protein [Paractinoplanes atraurantiacus]|uniref:BON domain-containing protein n=1 Tax=Paractinoplanes atraurantiacus TaxID=1036182 RepID=A0A285IUA9_9ACTN|nr:hypothetical protein [Actinoplanes atraurantiacus]SNY51615.1 hypothetical protein SAMN05421748_11230 [Actinoplanes atraurantiacus]
MIRSALLPVCLILGLAACTADDSPSPAPSSQGTGTIELVPDDTNPDDRVAEILTGEATLVSHAFNNGVIQVGVRSSVDERLRLCDRLADEFRDNQAVDQILVTAVPAAPLVHWNSSDAQCTADPATP